MELQNRVVVSRRRIEVVRAGEELDARNFVPYAPTMADGRPIAIEHDDKLTAIIEDCPWMHELVDWTATEGNFCEFYSTRDSHDPNGLTQAFINFGHIDDCNVARVLALT